MDANNDTSNPLAARIARLERANRRMTRLLAGVMLLLLLTAAGTKPSVEPVLRTQRLDLVTDTGELRARLGIGEHGGVLQIFDAAARVRFTAETDADGPHLFVHDETGAPRIQLFHQPDTTALFLKDGAGHTRVGTALFPHGGGYALHGEESKGAAVLTLMKGLGELRVYDDAGKVTARFPARE